MVKTDIGMYSYGNVVALEHYFNLKRLKIERQVHQSTADSIHRTNITNKIFPKAVTHRNTIKKMYHSDSNPWLERGYVALSFRRNRNVYKCN